VKEFIEYIAKNLVDKPEGVIVEESVSAGVVHYQLLVDPGETGKVIGKKGKTAKAMRVLLIAVGAKNGKKVSLEIPDRVLKES